MKYNVLLLVAAFSLGSTPSQAAEAPPRMISVSGVAREEAVPDRAVLSGQIVTRAKKLADAKLTNDRLANKLFDITKQFNIPKEDVSASNVFISPEYIYNSTTNKQVLQGYIVSRNLTITMKQMEQHEQVLSALVDAGIDQVNGVSFTISEPEARADALRVKAVQNARAKAQMLAGAAGAKLGKVITITTDGSVMPPPMPMMARAMDAKMAVAESSAPSLPGMTTLEERVSVTFELE